MIPSFMRIPWGRNHKCEQPSRLVFLDTETLAYPTPGETLEERRVMRLGAATLWTKGKHGYAKRKHHRFNSVPDFWEWMYGVLRRGKPTWVYSCNAANHTTMLGLWGEIDKGICRIIEYYADDGSRLSNISNSVKVWRGKTALDGIPFIVESRSDFGPIKFVDTLNYWNVPIHKLSKYSGIRQLEYNPLDTDELNKYNFCERNIEILESAVIGLMTFWKQNNLGNWQPTLASLSYSSYRHGKEKCQIVSHGDYTNGEEEAIYGRITNGDGSISAREITDVERRCYHGGRTECYYIGEIVEGCLSSTDRFTNLYHRGIPTIEGPVTVFDVNSMYPYVMKAYSHPFELMDAIRFPQLAMAQRLIDEFWCCADVEIITDEAIYPKRDKIGTTYPIGRFRTSIGGIELSKAVQSGHIVGIINLCVYYSGRPFDSFITYWHGKRKDAIERARDIDQRFCNDIMRSLYGKLAQKTPPWKTDGTQVPPLRWGTYFGNDPERKLPCIMRAIGGVSQYKAEQRSCRHTFVAAAASVTAGARNYMQTLISHCPPNSIVYMDTDSLFTLPPATSALKALCLVHQTELGKLKEKGTYKRVRIWGPKDYELDGVRTIAGLSSDNVEISERVWNQVTFEGIRSVIQHEPDYACTFKTSRFSPSGILHSRTTQWDGWTKPIEEE